MTGKSMKTIHVFFFFVLLVIGPGTLQAQTVLDMTIDDFKGQKFANVQKNSQKYIDECTSLVTRGRLPKFGDSFKDQEYQVILNQAKTGTCENKSWNDGLKRLCMQTLFFYIKTEDDFKKYIEDAHKLGLRPKSIKMAYVLFYKDPSFCDSFLVDEIFQNESEEAKRVSYSICQAITTSAGINACSDHFKEGTEPWQYCAEGYTIYKASQTKDINECKKISIRDDMLRLQCEILVDPSDVETKVIKHYTENQCYKPYAIPLAVVGTLDPKGPGLEQADAYCYKIKEYHETDFKKCQELVHEAREYVKESTKKDQGSTEAPSSP